MHYAALVSERKVSFESGEGVIEYYLVSDRPFSEKHGKGSGYGIKVVKWAGSPEERENEFEIVRNIFSRREEAVKLIEVLRDNSVTPVVLCDVVEDFIGRYP